MTALLETKGLSVRFGGLLALSQVDFEVNAGELRGIIGPNGAGKTTLLNVISGVSRPTAGRIRLDDVEITAGLPHRITRLGMARSFQNPQVFDGLTVVENVMVAQRVRSSSAGFISAILRTPKARREEALISDRAIEAVQFVGLQERKDMEAIALSYGEKKLLEIARALATDPKLLLLDEPSAGLNEREGLDLIRILREIRNRGVTILLIEHNMPLVMALSDRISVFDFGVKIAEGSPEEIYNHPRVTEAYLGSGACFTEAGRVHSG
jgi:branched-chain amino acid transport system ATP-binding protein